MPGDVVEVGDLFVAEGAGDEAAGVEISSIEAVGGGRVPRARADAIVTLWTRVVEDVVVPVSVHRGRETIPLHQRADGEEVFVVGEVYTFGGKKVRISHIKSPRRPRAPERGVEDARAPSPADLRPVRARADGLRAKDMIKDEFTEPAGLMDVPLGLGCTEVPLKLRQIDGPGRDHR